MGAIERCKGVGRGVAAAGAIAGMLTGAAQAQEQLPVVDVISATTVPTPANQIGSSVTVITAADIEREQRRTVPDLLATVPGLNVVQTGSSGTLTAVFIRGTNSNHVKVLLDGMDIGDPSSTAGAVDFGHLTTMDLERVEVLRGPQSGLYGADSIGGVITLTTKKGSGPTRTTAMIEGGSFGTLNQAASVSGSNDRINYAFNVSHFHSQDTPVTPSYMVPPGVRAVGNYYDNWTYSTRLGANLSDYLAVNLYGRYTNAKLLSYEDDFNAFPGVILPNQSTYYNRNFYGRAEAVVRLWDGRFVNVFGASRVDYSRSNATPDLATYTTFDGVRDKYDWRGTLTVAPGHVVVMGLERETQNATTPDLSASTGNSAGYLEVQSEFAKRFFVVANVRHDRNDQFGGHTTWRVAPAFLLPDIETKFKGSYGTGFKAPTLYQLYGVGPFGFHGNPDLKPEISTGYDFGFEQPIGNDLVRFGATYYRNDILDLIDFTFVPFTNINIDRAVTYGVEAFVAARLNDKLQMRMDYTYTYAWNVTKDEELRRRPRHKYSWTTIWLPWDKLTVTSTVLYLGPWLDIDRADFSYKYGGNVWTVNVAANYKVDDRLTLFMRADNLFNQYYENPLGWVQPGLAVYAGMRLANR